MKITRQQLRRIIRESSWGRSEHDAEARGMVASYQRGYDDGWSTPGSPPTTGRDPEYLRGYEKGAADAEDASGKAKYIREAISEDPTGRVEVEWDFEMDDDDEWNALTYEEQAESEGIPPVIDIPSDVMVEYQSDAEEYGEAQAEDIITNWLSDETGWLHQGWSWVR